MCFTLNPLFMHTTFTLVVMAASLSQTAPPSTTEHSLTSILHTRQCGCVKYDYCHSDFRLSCSRTYCSPGLVESSLEPEEKVHVRVVALLVPAGFYMMVNTGANYLPSGQAGSLVSPFRKGSTKTECVSFWYHMGGMNPGETQRLPARLPHWDTDAFTAHRRSKTSIKWLKWPWRSSASIVIHRFNLCSQTYRSYSEQTVACSVPSAYEL